MKKLFFILFILSSTYVNSQHKLLFSYDLAGNQSQRKLCINCPVNLLKSSDKDNFKVNDEIVIDRITFYPNPVLQELNINWKLIDEKKIVKILVFNLNGESLIEYNDLGDEVSKIIPFINFPSSLYNVILVYNNGEEKNLKILKK